MKLKEGWCQAFHVKFLSFDQRRQPLPPHLRDRNVIPKEWKKIRAHDTTRSQEAPEKDGQSEQGDRSRKKRFNGRLSSVY